MSHIIPELEEKLTSRGIGTAENAKNQYGLVSFGAALGSSVAVFNAAQLESFANVSDLTQTYDGYLRSFVNEGDLEDGWAAIAATIGADTVATQFDDDAQQSPQFKFRDGAAVNLVLITDEPRNWQNTPQGLTQLGALTESGDSLFFELLKEMSSEELRTEESQFATDGSGNPIALDTLSDAVLTTIAPFDFQEASFITPTQFGDNSLNPDEWDATVMGVDVNVLDGINLDLNSVTTSVEMGESVTELDLASDVTGQATDVAVFVHRFERSTEDNLHVPEQWEVELVRKNDSFLDAGKSYSDIRDAFLFPCDNFGTNPQPCTSDQYDSTSPNHGQFIGQVALGGPSPPNPWEFGAEDYAFLTWEARGTAWDFEIIRKGNERSNHGFDGWQGEDLPDANDNFDLIENETSLFNLFNRAFVDDTFEKIRLQIADFDDSGTIRLSDDGEAYFSQAKAYADVLSGGGSVAYEDFRRFDLDNDGDFVSLDGGNAVLDFDDMQLFVSIFATVFGDSNFDYEYNSADNVVVGVVGEYEDGSNDNSSWMEGDWNGDFDFTSADLVLVIGLGHYENGFLDEDGDGIWDGLPVWALDLAMSTVDDSAFYLPTWSD